MELEVKQFPHTQKYAIDTFVVTAGKTLAIETSPAGDEILSEVVPAGKTWSVSIIVDITETDV